MAEHEETQAVEEDLQDEGAEDSAPRMELNVAIEDAGPCKKHIRVTIPRASIDEVVSSIVDDYMGRAEVPGFRIGHVPEPLVRRRFKKELADQVKQKILMQSLEQLAEDEDLDPINEPNLDLDAIEIPDEGDFEYEFDVEVRPEFDLPEYKGLKIERPVRTISDADVDAYLSQFLEQYGHLEPIDEAASPGDYVTCQVRFTHGDSVLGELDEHPLRLRPVLRFQDAELAGFDKLLTGTRPDDVREADLTVSAEAENVAMRGETVHATFTVLDVKRLQRPEMNAEFLVRLSVESEDELRAQIHNMLERQTTYEQRQATRRQVMAKITASAKWELPEDLVRKQVENALRREVLEMQQAGFTTREIVARENELRQKSLSMTRQNLKEHFVLDRIAAEENIEVTGTDFDLEIQMMAFQRGENPRRVRSRLVKSGMIENLEAQIRERKAVDVILENAVFTDVPAKAPTEAGVEAVNRAVCSAYTEAAAEDEDEDGDV